VVSQVKENALGKGQARQTKLSKDPQFAAEKALKKCEDDGFLLCILVSLG